LKFSLFYDPHKAAAEKCAWNVAAWLKGEGHAVRYRSLKKCDIIILFGGDGFTLYVSRIMAERGIRTPIARVKFGSVAYMGNIDPENVFQRMKQLTARDYDIEERLRLQMTIMNGGEKVAEGNFLNEIVIKSLIFKSLTIPFRFNGIGEAKRRGDGCIIATRTGSTGQNYSAFGPEITEEDTIVVAIISPTDRRALRHYFFIPAGYTIELGEIGSAKAALGGDGRRIGLIEQSYRITIAKSPISSFFIKFRD
jgi:NAD+ kinase